MQPRRWQRQSFGRTCCGGRPRRSSSAPMRQRRLGIKPVYRWALGTRLGLSRRPLLGWLGAVLTQSLSPNETCWASAAARSIWNGPTRCRYFPACCTQSGPGNGVPSGATATATSCHEVRRRRGTNRLICIGPLRPVTPSPSPPRSARKTTCACGSTASRLQSLRTR